MPAFDLPGTAEGVHMAFFDREFNAAIDQLADESDRTDIEVLTGQARRLLRAFVRLTRLAVFTEKAAQFAALTAKRAFGNKGRARAGWWVAWKGLKMFGIPAGTTPEVLARDEGEFIDGRQRKSRPFVVMANEVPYIDKLDREDRIIENGTSGRFRDMGAELERRYTQNLRRHSA